MTKRFSASNAAQLMTCHGSANLELAIPGWKEPDKDENDNRPAIVKGHLLHEIFAHAAEFGPTDMAKLVEALDYVAQLRKTRRFKKFVEHEFSADWLRGRYTTTPDLILYTQDELHVIDYKSGTIPVEAVGNHQLLYYATCVAHLAPKAKGVTVHIVQPWADSGINSWFVSTKELGKFMLEARDAEQEIINGSTVLTPSDHCTFCPANPHSRGAKGSPLCPVMLRLLYPPNVDEDAVLADL